MRARIISGSRLLFRAWYYFRTGYSTYLTFILGYVSTLITVYYLAIKNMPVLLDVFPHFLEFAVLATVVGVPLAVAVGWVHLKRSRLYSSEVDIGVESSPYYYKLPPGWQKEVTVTAMFMELRILRKLAETKGLLNDTERAELDVLERKYTTLLEGGYVGSPRRSLV